MRILSWTFFITVVAIALAVILNTYQGNVTFSFVNVNNIYVVSFAFFLLALIASFFSLYVLLRIIAVTSGFPLRVKLWNQERKLKTQQKLLENAWLNLLEGRFAHAERDMIDVAELSKDNPRRRMIAIVTSARASHALSEFDKRDKLISQARELTQQDPKLLPVLVMVQAEFMLESAAPQQALDVLEQIPEDERLPHALRLTLKAYQQLQRWNDVLRVVRLLSKKKVLSSQDSLLLVEQAAIPLLNNAEDLNKLTQFWKQLKDDEQRQKNIALAGARAFDLHGAYERSQKILETAINIEPADELFIAYAKVPESQSQARLQKTEVWLKKYPKEAGLLRAMGILCLNAGLWGPAQNYLERSLFLQADPSTRVLLASLFERTNRSELAVEHWRLASEQMLNIPIPAPSAQLINTLVITDELIEPDRGAGL